MLDDFAPGVGLADLSQVHGNEVAVAVPGAPRARADALVSDRSDVVLLVRAADCVPVILADPQVGVVAAAHAGRQGVVADVVSQSVEAMRARGAQDITAWIGPHVCGACYEVPRALQDEVAGLVPSTRSTTSWGTPALDIGAGVRAQLEAAGVMVDSSAARCTVESPDLYSYRRDGSGSGRLAGVVRLHP